MEIRHERADRHTHLGTNNPHKQEASARARIDVAAAKGITILSISDFTFLSHPGLLKARDYALSKGVIYQVGAEINTTAGHIGLTANDADISSGRVATLRRVFTDKLNGKPDLSVAVQVATDYDLSLTINHPLHENGVINKGIHGCDERLIRDLAECAAKINPKLDLEMELWSGETDRVYANLGPLKNSRDRKLYALLKDLQRSGIRIAAVCNSDTRESKIIGQWFTQGQALERVTLGAPISAEAAQRRLRQFKSSLFTKDGGVILVHGPESTSVARGVGDLVAIAFQHGSERFVPKIEKKAAGLLTASNFGLLAALRRH